MVVSGDLVATIGAALGIVLAFLAILGAAWRYVVLPNLREQLVQPLEDTRRQVTENKHRHRPPTVLDRLDDVEQTLEAIALVQQAILKQVGEHVRESAQDRTDLWLNVDRLQRTKRIGRKEHGKEHRDTGGS